MFVEFRQAVSEVCEAASGPQQRRSLCPHHCRLPHPQSHLALGISLTPFVLGSQLCSTCLAKGTIGLPLLS